MTGNIAFDIVIGLVFTYLLYSLYATILMELISSSVGLRAKNLRYALKRMLADEKPDQRGHYFFSLVTTFTRAFGYSPKFQNLDLYRRFMNEPSIKYLGSGGFGGIPSYLAPENFSKGIIDTIKKDEIPDFSVMAAFELGLEKLLPENSETKEQIRSLITDANNDPVKFRILLEEWFNNTMDRASGWFKQTTQVLLLFVGLFIVVTFNVDTLAVIRKLSTDKNAREQMVKLATDFNEKNSGLITEAQTPANDSAAVNALNQRLDSLQAVRNLLENDINNSQTILSSNWPVTDTIYLKKFDVLPATVKDSVWISLGNKNYALVHQSVDTAIFKKILPAISGQKLGISPWRYKWNYAMSGKHFAGYLLTILALSLGAPFWFDLLNKLVKLRTSVSSGGSTSASITTSSNATASNKDILNRVG